MHAELGVAYASLGLYAEAVKELQAALDLCPGFVDIRTKLGGVLRDMGLHDKAIREYRRALEERDYIPARLGLFLTLYAAGQRDLARTEINEVLGREPNNRVAKAYARMVAD